MAETELEETLEIETNNTNNGANKEKEVESMMSSDSSDSDDDDDQLEVLEKSLVKNPADYDSHVKYIKYLRKLGHIEKLRQARESMSAYFPFSPTMWQEWTKDEASLISSHHDENEAFSAITKLYERGVHDYLSVSLWCDYINFMQGHDPLVRECSPDGTSRMRDLFERAVPAAGLHVTEGSKIWEAYIRFEQAILDTINDSRTEEKEKQVQRIRSIFHRQLSLPLYESRSALLAYKSWEAEQGGVANDGIPSRVSSAYEKAMEMCNQRAHYEEQISRQDTPAEKLQAFMTYLKFEQSCGDPARVQILYERAVTEFPVSSDLWLDYIRYLDDTLKAAKGVLDVYSRATRNCTWIGELWMRYLLSMERARGPEEQLSNVFEQSLQCVFSSSEEYLDLFLTRIDGLRRRILLVGSIEDSLDYSVVRDTFQRATDYLSPHLKNTDGLLRLHTYWARLELNHGKDLVAVRGVWESLLKTSGSMLEAWKQYIAMEIDMGHLDEARRIYKRCYSKRFSGTGSEDICHSWVRFEREFGTLEDYDHAVRKVMPRLEELQLFRSQQESKSGVASVAQKEDLSKNTPQKRKMGARSTEEQPTSKRQKGTAHNSTKSEMEASQKSREENKVGSSEAKADKPETINEQQIKHSASRQTYTDQCTVFLSNLSLQAEDENLRDFFSDVGGVTAIRIIKDKFTKKPRGLAYVDFSDDAHLQAALAKNKLILLGKKVSIVRSDPKHNKRKEFAGRNTKEHDKREPASDGGGSVEGSDSQTKVSVALHSSSSASNWHKNNVQFKGKNTFAVPRTVRPLGWSKNEPKKEKKEDNEDNLRSNDEFRNLLLKK